MMLKVLGMAHEQAVKGLIRDAFSAEPWCDRWEDEDVFHSYILDVMGNQNSLALGLFSAQPTYSHNSLRTKIFPTKYRQTKMI